MKHIKTVTFDPVYEAIVETIPATTFFFNRQKYCPVCKQPLVRNRRKQLFKGKVKEYVEVKLSQEYCQNCDYGVGITGLCYE